MIREVTRVMEGIRTSAHGASFSTASWRQERTSSRERRPWRTSIMAGNMSSQMKTRIFYSSKSEPLNSEVMILNYLFP